ncbi:hypothetical protein GCM10023328_40660 [Modestobacter marinus]|uniref:Uncharacterized protein n=1 Tax=Modestobacter marinus TaxID=477641 RepID=A0A846LMI1_9ACTN|nr:hypothetical protein [Modestobacter marinus]NIH68631.1 hypothetical protein [Modestobacter marinus]GGL58826.1 hypothetical protein GCM10011589_13530 [Modestobacter marinus]
MNHASWHDDDDELLAELRAALTGPGPAPQATVDAARGAFAWRDVDRELELLVLTHDSSQDGVLVRDAAPAGPRTLVFEGTDLSVEVELEVEGEGPGEIVGQLIPPQPGSVVLTAGGGVVVEVDADPRGCFRLPLPDRGPFRLTCRTPGAGVTTEWLPL